MSLNFRFAIISDPHIALPDTVWNHPARFHLVELSIPAIEQILADLEQIELDLLLMPGDLTQHGEPENHAWLANRLARLPYPAYVVPGNHDVLSLNRTERAIALTDFPTYYSKFGYQNPDQLYYTREILPGVRLIGLNSNQFDGEGQQLGCLDDRQLTWLQQVLMETQGELVMVMIHHNVVEHLPGQSKNHLGRRYMLDNAVKLRQILRKAGVQLVFTGHLHVQDIAHRQGVYDITTGSLVTYPHPYRICHFHQDDRGKRRLQIESKRVETLPGWENLQDFSREWMSDRSLSFVLKLLTHPPLNVDVEKAKALAADLRYFWADITNGDPILRFPHFPPNIRHYFESFSAQDKQGNLALIDNQVTLLLN